MKRIVLFSTLTDSNQEAVLNQIFPTDMQDKVLSYVPSAGIAGAERYIEEWRLISQRFNAQFKVVDNSVNSEAEQRKLLSSNIVVISGGNTFELLRNLRESGLGETIGEFVEKSDFVLAGFSAGALVLTPSIDICNLPNFDENLVQIEEFSGLNLVDFEVFPHYDKLSHKTILESYRKTSANSVRAVTDEDYISIDR